MGEFCRTLNKLLPTVRNFQSKDNFSRYLIFTFSELSLSHALSFKARIKRWSWTKVSQTSRCWLKQAWGTIDRLKSWQYDSDRISRKSKLWRCVEWLLAEIDQKKKENKMRRSDMTIIVQKRANDGLEVVNFGGERLFDDDTKPCLARRQTRRWRTHTILSKVEPASKQIVRVKNEFKMMMTTMMTTKRSEILRCENVMRSVAYSRKIAGGITIFGSQHNWIHKSELLALRYVVQRITTRWLRTCSAVLIAPSAWTNESDFGDSFEFIGGIPGRRRRKSYEGSTNGGGRTIKTLVH